jgi:hypothetical protein
VVLLAATSVFAQEVVVGRDAEGRSTIRAVRFDGTIDIDGDLDEEIYRTLAPVTNFIQQIPTEGAPASERTEAWVFFDDDNL